MSNVPILKHEVERIQNLTRGKDIEIIPQIFIQEAARQAGRRLSPLLKYDPEYGDGKLYPTLQKPADVLTFADTMTKQYLALTEGSVTIVEDGVEGAKGLTCEVCGNYSAFANQYGCRLARIQQRIKMPLLFDFDIDY